MHKFQKENEEPGSSLQGMIWIIPECKSGAGPLLQSTGCIYRNITHKVWERSYFSLLGARQQPLLLLQDPECSNKTNMMLEN